MKELLRKKSVKISILLIILLVVMGIVGINVRSAQKSKEYKAHIAAAEKYLSELDYEQAIAEYTMAFEIDPKEEVVDALERTYLAYAQTYIDAGDYEKAVSILQKGYEMIRRESLQNNIAEVQVIREEMRAQEAQMQAQKELEEEQKRIEEEQKASGRVEFPFRMTDISIMGLSLSEDHFAQMEELFPMEWTVEEGEEKLNSGGFYYTESIGSTPDGWGLTISTEKGGASRYLLVAKGNVSWTYLVDYSGGGANTCLGISSFDGSLFDYPGINVPVTAGETYEDWCRVMQIDQIKENNLRPEERDVKSGIWKEDGFGKLFTSGLFRGEHWLFSSEGCQGLYNEWDNGAGYRYCALHFGRPDNQAGREGAIANIIAHINEGYIAEIIYQGW